MSLDLLDSRVFSKADALAIAGSDEVLPLFRESISIIVRSTQWTRILERCLYGDVTLIRVVMDESDPPASFPYAPSRRDAHELAKQFARNTAAGEPPPGPRRFEVGEDIVNAVEKARNLYDFRAAIPLDPAFSLRELSEIALSVSLDNQSRTDSTKTRAASN